MHHKELCHHSCKRFRRCAPIDEKVWQKSPYYVFFFPGFMPQIVSLTITFEEPLELATNNADSSQLSFWGHLTCKRFAYSTGKHGISNLTSDNEVRQEAPCEKMGMPISKAFCLRFLHSKKPAIGLPCHLKRQAIGEKKAAENRVAAGFGKG